MLNKELNTRISELEKSRTRFAVATVVRAVSPTAAKPGDKAVVTASGDIFGWIGGGCAQPAVIKASKSAIKHHEPTLIRVTPGKEEELDNGIVSFPSSCPSGGTLDIFIEPVNLPPVLWILGASPVAKKLSTLANAIDFEVKVVAPYSESAKFEVDTDVYDSFESVEKYAENENYIVVATQGKRDKAALEASLNSKAKYIGFVSSAKKAMKFKQDLVAKGCDKERVNIIEAPIGFTLNAKTPAEIAVSILAQLVGLKNTSNHQNDIQCDGNALKGTHKLNKRQHNNDDNEINEVVTPESAKAAAGGCCGK